MQETDFVTKLLEELQVCEESVEEMALIATYKIALAENPEEIPKRVKEIVEMCESKQEAFIMGCVVQYIVDCIAVQENPIMAMVEAAQVVMQVEEARELIKQKMQEE